jgi:hypothetical protein
MIEQARGAERLNAIANHPAVRPWVSATPEQELDLSVTIADPQNVALVGEHGAMLFAFLQQGLYEAHTMVLPEGRGGWALDFVQDCLKLMFCATGAMELMTRVPKGNLAARALARSIHGVYCFTNPAGWARDGKAIPADVFSLTIHDWLRTSPLLEKRGAWFHRRLEEEFAAAGARELAHPDDAVHDRYVGAAVEMLFGGQLDKAVIFYNRWASMAGYVPISIISRAPVTIDIGSALIIKSGDDFYVPHIRNVH